MQVRKMLSAAGRSGSLVVALVVAVALAPAAAYASDQTAVARMVIPGPTGASDADGGYLLLGLAGSLVVFTADGAIRETLSSPGPGDAAGDLAAAVSVLGDGAVDLALCGLLATRDRDLGYTGANSVILAGGACAVVKILTGRARPWVEGASKDTFRGPTLEPGYDSFPSGHTATAFALARVLATRYPRYRWWVYSLASLVGLSRIVSGQHWASDVAVGALVGIWSADHVMSHPGTGFLQILRW